MQCGVVYSLNHDLTASLELHCTSIFENSPHLHWCIGIRVHSYASSSHTKVLQFSKTHPTVGVYIVWSGLCVQRTDHILPRY